MANPEKCPHCGGRWGVVTHATVKYSEMYDWASGEYDSGEVGDRVSGGKNLYCSQCGKDVTKIVTVQRPK